MQHVVKLYCLPETKEGDLRNLHRRILECMGTLKIGVRNEDDLLVLFVPDMMKFGLGDEILVEIDLFDDPRLNIDEWKRQSVAHQVGLVVKRHFPSSTVQCHVYSFSTKNGLWNSLC